MVQYNQNIADGHYFNNEEIIPTIATDVSRLANVHRVIQLNADDWVKDGDKYRLRNSFDKVNSKIKIANEDEDISYECKSLKSYYEEVKKIKINLITQQKIVHDEL